MPASTSTSDADIIFNRANVALAKSQRLIASWLPPRTEEELRAAKSPEEIEREEAELFAPIPEHLGLGAPLPKDVKEGDARRQELSSNDKLRKRLLGKEFAKLYGKGGSALVGSKPRPVEKPKVVEEQDEQEEEEEEEGRSSMGRTKRKLDGGQAEIQGNGSDSGAVGPSSETKMKELGRSSKRTSSYLDEVLAEKQRKKQKKKSKSRANPPDGKD